MRSAIHISATIDKELYKKVNELKDTYSKVYVLERERVEINKKINLLNKHLKCLLNYMRFEKWVMI